VAILTARELGITVWRARWAREGLALPARRSAKYKTFVQGVALIVAVTPGLSENEPAVVGTLWLAVAWTVFSGLQYVMDGKSALSQSGS